MAASSMPTGTVHELSRSRSNIQASTSNLGIDMSSVDFDRDIPMSDLESQWRQAHEATTAARTHYQGVAERLRSLANLFETARENLEILEILEARSLARMQAHCGADERRAETA
jgi:hypothetical protein